MTDYDNKKKQTSLDQFWYSLPRGLYQRRLQLLAFIRCRGDKAQQRILPVFSLWIRSIWACRSRALYRHNLRLKDKQPARGWWYCGSHSRACTVFASGCCPYWRQKKANLIAIKPPRLLPERRNRMSPTCCRTFCDNDMGDSNAEAE